MYTSAAIPAQPSTKLTHAFRTRSAGTSAMTAPRPNSHIRPKVTKYAGAGCSIVNTMQKMSEAALTAARVTRIVIRMPRRRDFTAIHAARSMSSGHMT